MAQNTTIHAEVRDGTGKGAARKLRVRGRIPGICYGQNKPAQAIAVDPKALDRLIRSSESGMNTLIDLVVAGGGDYDGKKVLLKELQRDPVSNAALHADFFALDMTHKLDVAVPIHLTGTAPGVVAGGILDQVLREVHLECLPGAIPAEITADVSMLEMGDSVHVRDLILPAGVELTSDPDLSVVSVVAPKAVEEELPAEGEAAAVEAGEAEGAEAAPSESESKGEAGDD